MNEKLNIIIVFSPDPVYMDKFICNILNKYDSYITAIIETKGSITKKKNISKQIEYFFTLLLILGFKQTIENTYKMIFKKNTIKDKIIEECRSKNIKYLNVKTINSEECIELLEEMEPDIVFNQSQHIIKKNVLEKAKIGFINRHGALLPKYRGRLAPFWQLLNKEKFGGITYHFIDEKIDNGKIIAQYPIKIDENENVNSLIEKMFSLAIDKFKDVIEVVSRNDYNNYLKDNDETQATYFSSPTLIDAMRYRFGK